jgi:SSS family solute:Na+ symporter
MNHPTALPVGEGLGTYSGLHTLDWAMLGLYGAVCVAIGWWAARRRESTVDYFIGGRGVGAFSIGLSMFVTLFSTNSFLSNPGEIVRYGPVFLASVFLSAPLGYLLVAYLFLPVLMRVRAVSAYELLERQLGPEVRTLGALLYVLVRTVWMAVLVFFASTALTVIMGLPGSAIPWVTVGLSTVAVAYTTLGGLRAVMLTDKLQFFILLAGTVTAMIVVTRAAGGFDWVPTEWRPHWDRQPIWSWELMTRVTIVGSVLYSLTVVAGRSFADQTMFQRYMAAGGLRAARRAVAWKVAAQLLVSLLLLGTGLAVLAFYELQPAHLPAGQTILTHPDRLFPHFIAHELPIGFAGLVVAAMFAAAMSSVDSGVNAISAVLMNDLRRRRGGVGSATAGDDAAQQRFARWLAVAVGAAVILASLAVPHVPGNFNEIASRTTHIGLALLLGIFVIAFGLRGARTADVWVALSWGLCAGIAVGYWRSFTGAVGISWQYSTLAILLAEISAAWLCVRWLRDHRRILGPLFAALPWLVLYGAVRLAAA